ncbi:MAG: bacteriohemerythrin [Terracidiphilus sp.]
MGLISWSSKYSVGVKNLDDQHKKLIEYLNELHAAMLKGQAQSAAGALLPKMLSHAREHFSTEERLMESTKYSGLAEQRAEHGALLARIDEYAARHKRGDKAVYLELLNFMRDWLTQHMLQVDKKYTAWLNEHGIR